MESRIMHSRSYEAGREARLNRDRCDQSASILRAVAITLEMGPLCTQISVSGDRPRLEHFDDRSRSPG
jgi:hypothetical protein